MTSIVTMTVSLVPSLLAILTARLGRRKKADKPRRPPHLAPPAVLPNLPEVDKVDIRALLRKWGE